VKGGAYAGVDARTTQIIVEAAHFDPVVTRRTSRRLGIVIDGSKRFENNPSQELIPHALREVVALIKEIAGGSCEGSIDIEKRPVVAKTVTVDPARVNALLGLSLSVPEISGLIEAVGGEVEEKDGILSVVPPFERTDLNIEEDFIDEVGRLHGYQHIVSVVPPTVPLLELNARHFYSEKIRSILIGEGFSEVITSSFSKRDAVKLRNALASDKSYMRSSLRTNITEVLDKNSNLVDLLGAKDTRVFELGTVFTNTNGVIGEHVSLCIGVRGKAQGYTQKDDMLLSGPLASLEKALEAKLPFVIQKGVAELNLSEVLTSLPSPAAYEAVTVAEEIVYKPFSSYPAISRDIAMWVTQGTDPEEVKLVLEENATELRVRTTLVDVFTKEGKTSYAFRLVFQSYEKTLTDEEVNAVMSNVYAAVHEKGWEVR
jgi:phenylalanyl-tRNA synthetase beta chain